MNRTPAEKLKALVAECKERYDHWNKEREEGCSDPNWSDGENLNLVRNHISYFKREIRRICDENNFIVPAVYYHALPPEMPTDFFVIGGKNYNPERINRILRNESSFAYNSANKVESTSQKDSGEYQLSLF